MFCSSHSSTSWLNLPGDSCDMSNRYMSLGDTRILVACKKTLGSETVPSTKNFGLSSEPRGTDLSRVLKTCLFQTCQRMNSMYPRSVGAFIVKMRLEISLLILRFDDSLISTSLMQAFMTISFIIGWPRMFYGRLQKNRSKDVNARPRLVTLWRNEWHQRILVLLFKTVLIFRRPEGLGSGEESSPMRNPVIPRPKHQ